LPLNFSFSNFINPLISICCQGNISWFSRINS